MGCYTLPWAGSEVVAAFPIRCCRAFPRCQNASLSQLVSGSWISLRKYNNSLLGTVGGFSYYSFCFIVNSTTVIRVRECWLCTMWCCAYYLCIISSSNSSQNTNEYITYNFVCVNVAECTAVYVWDNLLSKRIMWLFSFDQPKFVTMGGSPSCHRKNHSRLNDTC